MMQLKPEYELMKEYIRYLTLFNEQVIKPNECLAFEPFTYEQYKLQIGNTENQGSD